MMRGKQEDKRWEEERNINSRRRRRQEARTHPLELFFSQEKVGPSEVLIGSSGAGESENGGVIRESMPKPKPISLAVHVRGNPLTRYFIPEPQAKWAVQLVVCLTYTLSWHDATRQGNQPFPWRYIFSLYYSDKGE